MLNTSWRKIVSVLPPEVRARLASLEESIVGRRLAKATFWVGVGEVASRIFTMASAFVLARVLGQVGFGQLAVIQSTIGLFGSLAGLGLGTAATKYVAELRGSDPARAGRIIGVATHVSWLTGAGTALVMWLSGQWLATNTLAEPQLGPLLQISSLLVLFGSISGVQSGALCGFEAFRRIATVNLWTGFVTFVLLVGATVQWGLYGAVCALVAARVVNCMLLQRALGIEAKQAGVSVRLRGLGKEWSVAGDYGLPVFIGGLFVVGMTWVCNALLVNTPNGYAEMGLFNAANQWLTPLMLLPGAVGQSVFPVLSAGMGPGELTRSRRVLRFSMSANAVVTIPMAVAGAFLSQSIMAAYGREFAQGWLVLVFVMLTGVLTAIQAPVGHLIAASGRMWIGSAMNLGWGVSFVVLTWWLLDYGAEGMALAKVLAYGLHLGWTLPFALSLLSTRGRVGDSADAVVLGAQSWKVWRRTGRQ
jgi:O-antigen/teichoic acid export membrane protein